MVEVVNRQRKTKCLQQSTTDTKIDVCVLLCTHTAVVNCKTQNSSDNLNKIKSNKSSNHQNNDKWQIKLECKNRRST